VRSQDKASASHRSGMPGHGEFIGNVLLEFAMYHVDMHCQQPFMHKAPFSNVCSHDQHVDCTQPGHWQPRDRHCEVDLKGYIGTF
jgi:hypothetical protein